MKPPAIATIVEGQGEVGAVPRLLRKVLELRTVHLPTPIRVKRYDVVRPSRLEHYARIAAATIAERGTPGAILVILDSDDDCPAGIGCDLAERLSSEVGHLPSAVVLAKRMYEAWLIGGGAIKGIANENAESMTNPKQKIRDLIGRYVETTDQASLTDAIRVGVARSACPSFDKLCRDVDRLYQAIATNAP